MPEYQFNTNLGPAPQQGTSLGDLINTARGVQAYQQAQQLNPLEVQAKQMAIEQAKKINPLEEQAKQTEVAKGKFGLTKEQGMHHAQIFGSLSVNKAILDAEADPTNKEKRAAALQEVDKAVPVLKALGANDEGLKPLLERLKTVDPSQYTNTFMQLANAGRSMGEQHGTLAGPIVTIDNIQYRYNQATNKLEPVGTGKTTPGAAPSAAKLSQPGAAQPLVVEDMPIKVPTDGGVLQLNTRQKARFDEGSELAKQSIEALGKANEVTQTIRKVRSTMGSATGSVPGQLLRNGGKWLAGSEELETLTKNLEDLYVRNSAAMGANTDEARNAIKTITGSPNITREALSGIVDRVEASNEALKRYNRGFNAYKDKTSPENAYIHTRQFQQGWNANADPLVFMAQSIESSNKSPAEKELMRQKMLKDLTDDELKDLSRKKKNIEKLERGEIR